MDMDWSECSTIEISSYVYHDLLSKPVMNTAERNTKWEFVKSFRCYRCKGVYKFSHMKKCDSCAKINCNDCVNSKGSWLHSTVNCEYCRGVTDTHTVYFLCSTPCIDIFLKERSKKRNRFFE